jgi:hypothetical protein
MPAAFVVLFRCRHHDDAGGLQSAASIQSKLDQLEALLEIKKMTSRLQRLSGFSLQPLYRKQIPNPR